MKKTRIFLRASVILLLVILPACFPYSEQPPTPTVVKGEIVGQPQPLEVTTVPVQTAQPIRPPSTPTETQPPITPTEMVISSSSTLTGTTTPWEPTSTSTPWMTITTSLPGYFEQLSYSGDCVNRPSNSVCLRYEDGYIWLILNDSIIGWEKIGIWQGRIIQVALGLNAAYYHILGTNLIMQENK